jgi:hypothetical protein
MPLKFGQSNWIDVLVEYQCQRDREAVQNKTLDMVNMSDKTVE